MSVLATLTVRSALVTALESIASPNNFAEVRPIPLSLAIKADLEKEAFKKFPGLKLPACLLALADAEDTGRRLERVSTWLAIVICKDPNGNADDQTFPRMDAIRALRGTQLSAGKLFLELDNEVTIVDSDPAYSVAGIKLRTREYGA